MNGVSYVISGIYATGCENVKLGPCRIYLLRYMGKDQNYSIILPKMEAVCMESGYYYRILLGGTYSIPPSVIS